MKFKYSFLITLIMFVFAGGLYHVNAQLEEMVVPWDDGNGNPVKNALRDAVMSDTLPDGSHVQNRVYKLLKGGVYWNIDRMDCSGFHLRLVGEPGDPNDPNGFPPVLQRVYNDGGDFVDDKLIVGTGDLTMQNIYVIHGDDQGVQTAYQPIEISSSEKRFVFDNVIFERSNFAAIAFTNSNNDIFITNCTFRNMIGAPSTQQWEGRGTSYWVDQDTIIFENNTLFNVNFTPFQLEGGAANYLRFNHNTFVNIGRNMAVDPSSWIEAYFTNNLLINPYWHGESFADVTDANRDSRQYYTGIWGINDLPSKYGPEEGRRILFAYNAAWRDPIFSTYYGDSIRAQPFVSTIGKGWYVDLYDQMVVRDTTWLPARPDMPLYFSESFIVDSMIQNIKDIRAGVNPAHPYFYRLPEIQGGGICNVCPSWPLPEDFSYTDNIIGSDGLHLGDLNWFPTEKQTFETNKDQYVRDIEKMAGQEIKYEPVAEVEAEEGTIADGASEYEFTGFSYFIVDNSGWIQWDFDMPSGQQVDLNISTHMRNNGTRGQRVIVNGVSVHDCFGWGEYIWDAVYDGSEPCENPNVGMPINEWTWTKIMQSEINEANALTLPTGANTIRIEKSWGFQNFHGIDVLAAGTENILTSLRVPNSTFADLGLAGLGAPWVPRGLKAVDLGSNGSTTVSMDAPADGNYRLQVYFQNIDANQTGQLEVDGGTPIALSFGTDPDSGQVGVLSGVFALTAGSHSFKLSGTGIKVDYLQLNKESIINGVRQRPEIPEGYALKQNYPNPFNPMTNIDFNLAKPSVVRLTIYDALGQRVATLIDNVEMNAGAFTFQYDARNLASGVYFYSLEAGDFKVQKKMMLLK